jgi:hypothetical protein
MTEHFNGLTPAEAERLAILAEEAGEIVQAVGKILRHGYESYNPTVPVEDQIDNRRMLGREIGNFEAIYASMLAAKDLYAPDVAFGIGAKKKNMRRYTHHQPEELLS